MRELVDRLLPELERGQPFALLTVVDEQGSTPRVRGASMIVRGDGSTVGTIGGGLLEASAMRAAVGVLARRRSVVVTAELNGRDLEAAEMVCGGSATVLVAFVPSHDPALTAIAAAAAALISGQSAWLLTACRQDAGDTDVSRWLWREGRPAAGDADPGVDLGAAVHDPRTRLALPDGRLAYGELLAPPPAVIICGAGHVGQALAPVAAGVGFRVVVLDDRPEFADARRFPAETRVLVIPDVEDPFSAVAVDQSSLVVIVTRGHRNDLATLVAALRTPARYIGLMSSRAKRKLVLAALRDRGFGDADLDRIHSPIGLPIGAETPAELAISIVAELIETRASWTATGR